jgi:hypothetical protein
LLPRLGAATVIALIVTGQMIGSHAFDHFGLLRVPEHPANLIRLTEAVLLFEYADHWFFRTRPQPRVGARVTLTWLFHSVQPSELTTMAAPGLVL